LFGKQKISVGLKIDSLIGKETIMSGNLESKGSIRIDGSFHGDISAQNLIIGEEALVQARIKCSDAVLAGRVEGNINAEGKLDIRATGVLIGDATVGSLTVEDGAVMTGHCKMSIREEGKRVVSEIFGGNSSKKGQEQQEK
jgi:cytoskeletal protein CcmA (bactofilin family)